jgi:glutaconate CoA-transferase subunit A
MKAGRWGTVAELVATIPDGAWLAPGGFMLGRAPMALVLELIAQGRKNLQVMSLPNPLPAEFLVAGGCLSRVELPFGALHLQGRVRPLPCLKRAIEQGRISWREHDGYRVVQRLRAASMGLPFIPAPDADVSELADAEPLPTVTDPFTGKAVPVEPAFYPDVALIHAQASRWSAWRSLAGARCPPGAPGSTRTTTRCWRTTSPWPSPATRRSSWRSS